MQSNEPAARICSVSRAMALLALLVTPLAAQRPTPKMPDSSSIAATVDPTPRGAPVLLDSDTLFLLYGRLGPFGPAERASAATQRIAALRRDLAKGKDSLYVASADAREELFFGDQVVMTVLDSDVTPTGRTRAGTAKEFASRIRGAVTSAEDAISTRALLIDVGYAAAATIVLILLLYLVRAVFRRIYAACRSPQVPSLRLQRFELLSSNRLGATLTVGARLLRAALTLMILYIYLPLVLSFFPWTAPYSRRIAGYFLTPIQSVGAGFLSYLPKIFFIVVIFLATRYLLKVIRLVFRAVGSGAITMEGFHPEWADPTYDIVRLLVIAFAAVIMFPYLPGAGSDAFKGVSLFVGVLFSLGSSGAVGNIVAGVVLTYTRAFRVGDRVKIGDTIGDVIEKTLLVTRVRTIKNVEVTIPNGSVLSGQVINYTSLASPPGLILHTTVTIGYDAPWAKVQELLIAAAVATDGIQSDPAPFVLQTSLDDFYVSYEINAYTLKPAQMAVIYSSLHRNIQDAFNAAGVEIMSPHYGALRDGNQMAIPVAQLPTDYRAPGFRVEREA